MFNQLGRLVWTPFTFLWTYVTLPALLVLLTIYFLNLYHRESLYYISWNDSMVRPRPRKPGDLAPYPVSLTLRDLQTPNPPHPASPTPRTWGTLHPEYSDRALTCISCLGDLGTLHPD